MTEPAATDPLTTLPELAVWVQLPEIPEDRLPFAQVVLAATAICIRHYGSELWTHDTIPPRAKLIADLKAKNFFEHPTGALSETVGPLSERFLEEVVQQLVFTPGEISLLAELAGEDGTVEGPVVVSGLWALSTTRGPLETHSQRGGGVITVPYWRPGSDGVPLYSSGAFGSPDEWDSVL